MDALRKSLIDGYITTINKSIGGVKQRVSPSELYDLHQQKKWPALVSHIRGTMGLRRFPMKVRVGKVSSRAAAMVERRRTVAFTDSDFLLKAADIRITLSQDLISNASANTVIYAISHEISHILLEALMSRLAKFEMAVDIAAMMSGYAEYYADGKTYQKKTADPQRLEQAFKGIFSDMHLPSGMIDGSFENMLFSGNTSSCEVGYLTKEEVSYVVGRVQQLRRS